MEESARTLESHRVTTESENHTMQRAIQWVELLVGVQVTIPRKVSEATVASDSGVYRALLSRRTKVSIHVAREAHVQNGNTCVVGKRRERKAQKR